MLQIKVDNGLPNFLIMCYALYNISKCKLAIDFFAIAERKLIFGRCSKKPFRDFSALNFLLGWLEIFTVRVEDYFS